MDYFDLIESYNSVHKKTWENDDFLESNLEISRSLYTESSLKERKPLTKELHVVALLYGLPFSVEQQKNLISFSKKVKDVLGDSMAYFVKPENLGLELGVLKWPEESYLAELVDRTSADLSKLNLPSDGFELTINGFQINPDGCFVVRGIDKSGAFRRLRTHLKDSIEGFPIRQSGWVHIPLGRILEPVGKSKFHLLKSAVHDSINNGEVNIGSVGRLKLIDETQWYMENHKILESF